MQQVSQNIRRGSHLCQTICNLFSPPDPFSLTSSSFPSLWPHQLSDVVIHKIWWLFSTRDALSVLQEILGKLGNLNISCSMAAINALVSAASLRWLDSLLQVKFFWRPAYKSHSVHFATNKDDKITLWGSIIQASIDGIWIANNIQIQKFSQL